PQPLACKLDQQAIEGVALGKSELTPDHMILGADIAADVDPLDVDARAFIDDKDEIDGAIRLVFVHPRLDLAEGVALKRHSERQRLGCLLDLLRVEPLSALEQDIGSKQLGFERRQRILDVNGAEPVARALVYGEGDEEA